MIENRNCKIIEDLLPNYIENLTNKETCQYIEEHLKECEKCKNSLENMKKDINIDVDKIDGRKVKYMKKFSKKMRMLKLIIFIIVAIFIISTGRKMIILSNLNKKEEKYVNSTNYHKIIYGYQPDYYVKTEIFTLGTKQVVYTTEIVNGQTKERKIYGENGKVNKTYTIEQGKKNVKFHENTLMSINLSNMGDIENNIIQLFWGAVMTSINTRTVNGKECYYITNKGKKEVFLIPGDGIYIEKETGLAIRTNGNEEGTWPQSDYIYEFDVVTEKNFIEPNINEYQIVN